MLNEGVRRFDLYDFFSVLIPGGAFLLGILPFAPRTFPVFSTAAIIMLVLVGFVAGRALHALGLLIENPLEDDARMGFDKFPIHVINSPVSSNHREYFIGEICNPDELSPGLVDDFYQCATDYFSDVHLPESREDVNYAEHSDELETLYTLVRSFIHLDARGRSRSFQAVLDFQRTMMVASVILFVIYVDYGIFLTIDRVPSDLVGYQSYIGSLNLDGPMVVFGAGLLLALAYTTFERIRSNYRQYFVQYLMSDFINLHRAGE